MSQRSNPPMPARPFGFLLVEGGDELGVCAAIAGASRWGDLLCWNAQGRDKLVRVAALALADPNFFWARSVGLVLDAEADPVEALGLASRTLAVFGATGSAVHGALTGEPRRMGAFLVPDGASPGCIETLCRRAVRDRALSSCVDALVACAGEPHASQLNAQANADKGWLKAYLAMLANPALRFHQAFSATGGIDPMHAVFDPLRTFLAGL